jgi:nitrogen fixation protein FixH
MKLNWGLGIAIGFSCFVIFMSILVIKSFNQSFDLVHEDYYGEELKYQDRINRGMEASSLKGKISYKITNREIILNFPEELDKKEIIGEVLFFRPSDKRKDFKATLQPILREQHFSLSHFSKGLYKMQVTWEAAGIKYYNEETIIL